MCGGTIKSLPVPCIGMGLSPRVRGNRQVRRLQRSRTGLSPRVRGNPNGDQVENVYPRVYPRVCGGTISHIGLSVVDKGLSPRVRGNPF